MTMTRTAVFSLSLALGSPVHGTAVAENEAAAVQAYRQRQADATPEAVLSWLKAGNARFAAGDAAHGGFPADSRPRLRVAAMGQRPLAAVLSCIDSRTAPEMVFDGALGDLFTVRVGANVTNDDVLGSLEIAAESGAKVIVVLGHTDCGGIKAACGDLKLGHFTQLLEKIKPAIAAAHAGLDADPAKAKAVGEWSAGNRRYIAELGRVNAARSVDQIRRDSQILREKLDRGEIALVSAVFDVDTGRVAFDESPIAESTRTGIPLDAPWKTRLYRFAQKHSTHTAWGFAHSERNYLLALRLAREERLAVDIDVLFAAAMLHDIGAQEPFAKDDVKHEPRAVEVMRPILKEAGFPMEKEEALAEVILRHMHYSKPGASSEAIVFRDADALDGLGAIGAARVLSTGGREDGWAPTMKAGLERIKKWQTQLPQTLSTAAAQRTARERVEELRHFLERLEDESLKGSAL